MKPREVHAILEALLFVAEEPVPAEVLAGALPEEARGEITARLEELQEAYMQDGRGLVLARVAGGWRLQTRPDLYPWVSGFLQVSRKDRLSKAALETLAVITYHQPLTGPEIGELRGVDPSSALKTLLEKNLIRISGRKQVVGKPFLYATTQTFLEEFGLDSLDDLPDLEEFEDLLEERFLDAQPDLFEEDAGEAGQETGDDQESAEIETTDHGSDAGRAEHEQEEEATRTPGRAETVGEEGQEEAGQADAAERGGAPPEDHRGSGDHQ